MTTIPILCLHAVSDDVDGLLAPWVMTPGRFDELLDGLDEAGYQPVPLDPLVARVHHRIGSVPNGAVVLTFDDGYADMADVIWPRLAERGWPATLYMTTAHEGETFLGRPMLDRRQIAELADEGLTIGAHGHRHVALDTVSPAKARDEIHRSRDLVEEWTGRAVQSFAYPHGFHNRRVRDEVANAGFTSACAVKQALSSPDDDCFALARIMPTGEVTPDELLALLRSPKTSVADGSREALRTTAYRYVRRARRTRAA